MSLLIDSSIFCNHLVSFLYFSSSSGRSSESLQLELEFVQNLPQTLCRTDLSFGRVLWLLFSSLCVTAALAARIQTVEEYNERSKMPLSHSEFCTRLAVSHTSVRSYPLARSALLCELVSREQREMHFPLLSLQYFRKTLVESARIVERSEIDAANKSQFRPHAFSLSEFRRFRRGHGVGA